MAVGDMPVSPLAVGGRFNALTDPIASGSLLTDAFQVWRHDLLADRIGGSGVVHQESAVVDGFKIFHAYRMAQDRGKVKGLWTVRQLSQSIIGVAVDVSFQVKFFFFDDIKNITRVSVNFIEHFVDESVKIHWKFLNCVNNTPNPYPVVQSWTVYKVAQ